MIDILKAFFSFFYSFSHPERWYFCSRIACDCIYSWRIIRMEFWKSLRWFCFSCLWQSGCCDFELQIGGFRYVLLTYVVCGMEFNLEVDRTVQCSWTVQILVMFERFEVQVWGFWNLLGHFFITNVQFWGCLWGLNLGWAQLRYSNLFKVQSSKIRDRGVRSFNFWCSVHLKNS